MQGNPNPLCERGASLKRNLVIAGNVGDCCRICRPLDPVLFVFFWAKAILETFTVTMSLCVTRKNNPSDFNHIE